MRRILPLLLSAPVLMAQAPDPWQQLLQRRTRGWQSPVVSAYGLFYPKSMLGPWQMQDYFVRLRVSGDLGVLELDDAEAKVVQAHLGQGQEPRWVLVSPNDEVLGTGTAAPDPDQIRKLLENTGWRSRWDLRAEFLRQHPDSGDAWSDELREQARFVGRQAMLGLQLKAEQKGTPDEVDTASFDPDQIPTDATEDEPRWGPMAKAMHGLMEVDGWTGWSSLGSAASGLRIGGAKGSGVLKPEFERLRREVESALRREPSSESLWEAWSTASAMGEVGDPEALLASLEPVPGKAWPPLAAADALGGALTERKDWPGLDRLAAQALDRALAPEVLAGGNSRVLQFRAQDWAVLRVRALLHLNRITDAASVAASAREHSGRAWSAVVDSLRAEALSWASESAAETPTGSEAADGKGHKPQVPAPLAEVLDRGPVAWPSRPALPPPLTLALIGAPSWASAFQRLKDAPALDPWEPGEELTWGALDAKRAQALKAQAGWGAEPRWVLMRGEEVLDSGTGLPEAKALADRLRAQGQPFLEKLNAFIRRHPDHLEASRSRMEEILSRMPNQRLEATLLEDAKATLAPFKVSGEWTPMKELWEPAAQRLLPELESSLRSWPEDPERWLAYVDWSNLHPRKPSPADLLSNLPIWKTRMRGGAGPLPDEVGMAVAERLQAQGRWEPLAAWCRAFWEGGLREQMKTDALARRRPGAVLAEWGEMEKRLVLPYREALLKLSRAAELRSLDQDLKEVRGVLPPPPRPRPKG